MIGGGHNAQSDKNAAEAAAFAEQMRGVFAELEELSAYRAAAYSISEVCRRQGAAGGSRRRWSGCASASPRAHLAGPGGRRDREDR
jgi:hypothetical protein